MFVHSVYFWLKPDLTDAERDRFHAGVHSLTTIESVRHGFAGAPAATDRPIIDRSYSCALIVMFDDEAGHDAYQVHPIHDRFRQECAPFWSKVLIYDAID
jgi:Stress responsive A/B Barrel Domain